MTRDEAVLPARQLMAAAPETEAEGGAILEALERGLRCPHISDYTFYPGPGRHPSAEQVVERAVSYGPIAL
ncbi:e9imm peptide [Streptomyces sp. NBC_00335]|uniref:e9imm peptide n=1 Tax=unclassified Streptomyces TaxID=2593676 RepID=UPI002255239C|nr:MULTISPECIES: e9imm peptide [unclassified Streptomyces]MCX5407539.1 e9imm peptide [Streptomyces sp. NBC_00086]